MALEDRSSPNNAASPGPNQANQRPGLEGSAMVKSDDKNTNLDKLHEINKKIKLELGTQDNYEKPVKIWRQISPEPSDKLTSSYSIDKMVDINKNRTNTEEPNNEDLNRIKFSVDNILKPDFGCRSKTEYNPIWNPLKRTITPIIRASDEVRKPRTNRNRNFDGRFTESNEESDKDSESVVKSRRSTTDETRLPLSSPAASSSSEGDQSSSSKGTELWPAWVYCTRYSDRPSSGPRSRRMKRKEKNTEEKRPRTAFSGDQLSRLKHEFVENRYLTERRRQDLAKELGLNEAQIKIWFQNKRAKMKKARAEKNPLALQLMAQGLYNHSTVPADEEEFLEELAMTNTTPDSANS